MADNFQRTGIFVGTGVLLWIIICDCRPLDGYEYPVFTTDVCPKNLTEWQERSSALNCNKTNAYMCVPNENFTELLEFCYNHPQIRITKGLCMFLVHHSTVNAYGCSHFTEGCPISNYRSQDVNKYQSCVTIANGCFLAEPTCVRVPTKLDIKSTTTVSYSHTTEVKHQQHTESYDWVWIVTILVVAAAILISICIFRYLYIIKGPKKKEPNKTEEADEEALLNEERFDTKNVPMEEIKGRKKKEPNKTEEAHEEALFNVERFDTKNVPMEEMSALNRAKVLSKIEKENESYGETTEIPPMPQSPECFITCIDNQYAMYRLVNIYTDINEKNKDGYSPLHTVCENGFDAPTEMFLKLGADINIRNNEGATPLFLACNKGNDTIAKLLLKNQADVNLQNNQGRSPLFMACCNGDGPTAEVLLENKADIDLCDNEGTSPLSVACSNRHQHIVELLVNNHADINLCDNEGTSPLSKARYNEHKSTAEFLCNRGEYAK